jgi:hypothetical protein
MGESTRSAAGLSDARLASLAILRINWDTQQQSWIDNFVPFATECLRVLPAQSLEVGYVQRAMRDQFGLEVPVGALWTILRRAVRRGFATQENRRLASSPMLWPTTASNGNARMRSASKRRWSTGYASSPRGDTGVTSPGRRPSRACSPMSRNSPSRCCAPCWAPRRSSRPLRTKATATS